MHGDNILNTPYFNIKDVFERVQKLFVIDEQIEENIKKFNNDLFILSNKINTILGIQKTYFYNGQHRTKYDVFNNICEKNYNIARYERYHGINSFNIIVCFPLEGLRFDLKYGDIEMWPQINTIINGEFIEKNNVINVSYYDEITKTVVSGCKLIISSLPIESIMVQTNTVKVIYKNINNHYHNHNNDDDDNDKDDDNNEDVDAIIKSSLITLKNLLYIQDNKDTCVLNICPY